MHSLVTALACWWVGENVIAWLRLAADRFTAMEA
jgi:hypothetical protein